MKFIAIVFACFSVYLLVNLFFSQSGFSTLKKQAEDIKKLEIKLQESRDNIKSLTLQIKLMSEPVNIEYLKFIIKKNIYYTAPNEYLLITDDYKNKLEFSQEALENEEVDEQND